MQFWVFLCIVGNITSSTDTEDDQSQIKKMSNCRYSEHPEYKCEKVEKTEFSTDVLHTESKLEEIELSKDKVFAELIKTTRLNKQIRWK